MPLSASSSFSVAQLFLHYGAINRRIERLHGHLNPAALASASASQTALVPHASSPAFATWLARTSPSILAEWFAAMRLGPAISRRLCVLSRHLQSAPLIVDLQ